MKTKADLFAFLGGAIIVLVGRFILDGETKETFIGLSLQGFSYVIGLLSMAYAILPQFGLALLERLGLKLKAVRVSEPCEEPSEPPPAPKKLHRHKERLP